jgi:hypothetical protein
VRTYKEIADFVMSKIAELGEADRAIFQSQVQGLKSQVKERELSA